MTTAMEDFVRTMPKCELHLHVEGTLEPELKLALATRNGIALAQPDEAAVRASYDFDSLTSFLVVYYDSMRVLLHEQDFYDLAFAYLQRAADERIRYVEMFFDPQAHTSRGVPFPVVLGGLRRAVVDARRLLDVRAELILCFLRDLTADYAMATLMEALPYKDWILGIGLDSDERGNPPAKFADVFARARAEGFLLTMHCDVDQAGSTEHLRQVLDLIAVDRIDHGVNVLDDPALVRDVAERGLGLTVCPVSNRWVTGDTKAAQVRALLDAGIRVTVNSDDPAYFAAYLSDNYLALQRELDLGNEELVALARNGFEVAWLPGPVRDGYLAELAEHARKP